MTMLNHLKVLDFSSLLPGPFATLMLADLGADVLHVSRPANGATWSADRYLNRSKHSVTADLKDPKTVDRLKEIAKDYDIVVEQFRPGVMDRLGLGYEAIKEVNPSVIYCSITGYGQTGPYRDRPGHDINYVSMAGLAQYSGSRESGPANNSVQIADLAGGSLHSVIAILAAIVYREKTGKGQWIDISMTDCAFTLNAIAAQDYFEQGIEPGPEQSVLNGGSFYGYYKTKDGRYFSVGSLEPKFRSVLCRAIDRDDLIDICMSPNPEASDSFKEELKLIFLERTFDEWMSIFEDIKGCVEPVLTIAESCEHPHFKARDMIIELEDKDGRLVRQMANPIKSSEFESNYRHPGSEPGKDNDKFLFTR